MKLGALKQPYRREALENFRATMTADIAAVVERVRLGATFLRDARRRHEPRRPHAPDAQRHHRCRVADRDTVALRDRLRSVPTDRVSRCSIAWSRRRNPTISVPSLAAARPVTTSALLATYLCGVDGPFAGDDAKRAVRKQLDNLPANVFPDPELQRAPRRCRERSAHDLGSHGVPRRRTVRAIA